jgi:two-component system, cell cycle response regulator
MTAALTPRRGAAPAPPPGAAAGLDARLDALELELYVNVAGIAAQAGALAAQARGDGATFQEARAELVLSDALSRSGALQEALAIQSEVSAQARARGDALIDARAACLLSSTYWRIGLAAECQLAAEESVRLLEEPCPPHWPAEHYMVLALWTSHDRAGAVDFALFEESVRRARELDAPLMLLAILNNYAWTACQHAEHVPLAERLVAEMELLVDSGRAAPSAATLDTIGWVHLLAGRLDRAERVFADALASADRVEPDDEAAMLSHRAEVWRRQGRLKEASALLERARAIAIQVGTPEYAVEALRELARIDAALGDHRRAYRRLARFVDEQRSAERAESERRATIVQSVYGTQVERAQRRFYERLASRDALTDLLNRRHVEAELPRLLAAGRVAVAMLDVDHFKRINDRHSHDAGDAVLRRLAQIFEEHVARLSPGSFAARLGGEEFVLVVPALEAVETAAALEAVRHAVEVEDWSTLAGSARPTVSVGLVSVSPGSGLATADVLGEADGLLYEAKRLGRNRIRMGVL